MLSKVSVHLNDSTVIVKCTDTFWSPCRTKFKKQTSVIIWCGSSFTATTYQPIARTKTSGPPLFGCLRMLIQYILSYPPLLQTKELYIPVTWTKWEYSYVTSTETGCPNCSKVKPKCLSRQSDILIVIKLRLHLFMFCWPCILL